MTEKLRDRSIVDFGEQWMRYQDNDGYYGSMEMFRDIFAPLMPPEAVAGCRVAEIGSGTGRIVNMLLKAGASHIVAVEPSEACAVLRQNTSKFSDKVCILQKRGDELPPLGDLDYVFSVGVLHHIPDPVPVVRAAYRALRPGGKIAVWLYGKEGNRLYLSIVQPVRMVTRRLPHAMLAGLTRLLDLPLLCYIKLSQSLPLPMHHYMSEVMACLDGTKRRLTIYDQLNPAYAKYYTREEAESLLSDAGFMAVRSHHRHGYSWSLIGTKPMPS